MCGIVGLFLKTPRHEHELGLLAARMLEQMRDRGMDSAGFAVYSDDSDERVKVTVLAEGFEPDWDTTGQSLAAALDAEVALDRIGDHATFATRGDGRAARQWLIDNLPGATVLSYGHAIELFKAVGDPRGVAERYGLAQRSGTHAIAHTRMATESAVTTNGSHPFSTGADTCLVHNGSLSNYNRLREVLEKVGETFQTENDSEVAAGYLSWRLREGDSIDEALERSIGDLDGFYTFAVGVREGFAVLRDPIACKPGVIAETDDWVAMSSEFRGIAGLPGAADADIWEPAPAVVYTWRRGTP
ncbi:MAG: amidophosphoribosyltransferase [Acidimicrobiia bacterium]|nr:amidophosphoribosyltransferase [Acidimicrobiia bacterium]MYE67597.1 amidophosphoribosyltransferase [Acidimicrobiia bacterium]MYJ13755.1 amidophosphoribosyltransferase [Acidimicrobiia bacterium]